jgi:hypothetical protein
VSGSWIGSLARWVGALPLLLTASPAWACPYCAARSTPFGTGRALLVAAILALPFALAAAVIRTVRTAELGPR